MSKAKYVFNRYCEGRDSDGNRVKYKAGDEISLTAVEAKAMGDVITKATKAKESDDETDPDAGKDPQGGGQQ
ncbi:MAG TPA: hypothetical protein DEG76_02495 [Pseudohongiella sp.]|nr:hypothetical protein [Pseudohongiella sp.]HBX36224.1 hypothetical protein [Pseudohongiella sp.]|tara:strand:- start:15309 stop:15524 length:216 start_codon:yes stop_codon:yes gene_type:complete